MNGIVLINKPAGMTSFKVTAAVRKKLNQKRAGHAGTLDPLATGVLPVMAGQATRLIDILPSEEKRYTATFMLGMTTDTLDCDGEVLTDQPVNVTPEQLKSAILQFTGEITQIPPMYSALKKDGVRLYELARQGVEVEREKRVITIHNIELLTFNGDIAKIDVRCSKGTYIRTLIDDIGAYLGCGAYMTELQRTSSNGFCISQCITLDEFMNGDIQKTVLPPDYALKDYIKTTVTEPQAKRFLNGGELFLDRIDLKNHTGYARVYSQTEFIGLGIAKDDVLKPKCVFNAD